MPFRLIRDQWFLLGIFLITILTFWNPGGWVDPLGQHLTALRTNEVGILLIFFLSGLELESQHLWSAVRDWKGTSLALIAIFIIAPLLAWALSYFTSSEDLRLGLFLIGVVPTTLASGIVMSGSSGGSIAQAMIITIVANILSIVTVPLQLSALLHSENLQIHIPYGEMSLNLLGLIVAPLIFGMTIRKRLSKLISALPFPLNLLSRGLVLLLIFMGLQKGRADFLGNGEKMLAAVALVLTLHLSLAGILWFILKKLRWETNRRQSVFFMGTQKTLPLCIWLQTTFFPTHGLALVVCILYHIIQLVMGSYFVGRFSKAQNQNTPSSS